MSFKSLLQASYVGPTSPYINSNMPHDIIGKIPSSDSLVQISSEEHFPLSHPKEIAQLPTEEMETYFTQMQAELLLLNQRFTQTRTQAISGPLIEIPDEFNSIEDFIQFKRELATVYKARTESYGWEQMITVCHEPLCLNSTPPGFSYCCFHIQKDKHYNDQIFIKQCRETLNNHKCPIPCGNDVSSCVFHQYIKQPL